MWYLKCTGKSQLYVMLGWAFNGQVIKYRKLVFHDCDDPLQFCIKGGSGARDYGGGV